MRTLSLLPGCPNLAALIASLARADIKVANFGDSLDTGPSDPDCIKMDETAGVIGFRTTDPLHQVSPGFDFWLSSAAPTFKSWIK